MWTTEWTTVWWRRWHGRWWGWWWGWRGWWDRLQQRVDVGAQATDRVALQLLGVTVTGERGAVGQDVIEARLPVEHVLDLVQYLVQLFATAAPVVVRFRFPGGSGAGRRAWRRI